MTDDTMNTPDTGVTDELPKGTPLMTGQYEIANYLNHGGFGITYVATDSLDRQVVVKECFPGNLCRRSRLAVEPRSRAHVKELQGVVQLFLKEARALSKLAHPNIVGVHQVFEDHGTAYMVLDYVSGSDLLTYIEDDAFSLTPEQVKTTLTKMLDAVGFVHEAGLLHRDISPDNIILTDEEEPILIDFGAAREQATKTTQALSALRVVKDGYSPQEFYLAGSAQGPASDLYSLAATFYHIITGNTPPDSQLRITAHVAGEADPYVSLGKVAKGYDEVFCAAIDKALAVLPKDRFQNAGEWKKMLESGKVAPKVAEKPRVKSKPISKRVSEIQSRRLSRKPNPVMTPTAPKKRVKKAGGAKSRKMFLASTAAVLVLAGGTYFAGQETSSATAPAVQPTPAVAPVQETGQDAAAQPALATPAPAISQAAAPAPAPASAEVVLAKSWADDKIGMSSRAELDFDINDDLTLAADDRAAMDLPEGATLARINGVPVTNADDVRAAMTFALDASNGEVVALEMDWAVPGADEPTRTEATAEVVYETAMLNGAVFETRRADNAWVTTLVDLPNGVAPELQVGDEIVAVINGNAHMTGATSLGDAAAAALADENADLKLAIRRGGTLWSVGMKLSGETG